MKKLQPLLLELMNHAHPLEDTKDSGSATVNIFKKQGKFNIKTVTSERINLDEVLFEIVLRNSFIKDE
jgi:hypothetical protein